MTEHSRGRQMVVLATRPRYHVAKILELNEIITVRDELLRASNDANLKTITYKGKEYQSVVYDSGDFPDMEITREKLVDYERKLAQYRNLACNSQAVQTDIVAATTERPAEDGSFFLLRSALSTLREEEDDSMQITESETTVTAGQTTSQENLQLQQGYDIHSSVINAEEVEVAAESETTVTAGQTTSQENLQLQQGGGQTKKKMYFCIFCKQIMTNLPRHFLLKHQEEERVREFSLLPNKDRRRLQLVADLRREGIAAHNKILKEHGQPVKTRKGITEEECLPCPRCQGFFKKNTLNRHFKNCSGEKKAPKNIISLAKSIIKKKELKNVELSKEFMEEVLPGMTMDCVTETIYKDPVILEYGNMLSLRHSSDIKKQKNMIRSKMRGVAKFKNIFAKKDPSMNSLEDIFHQDKWQLFIDSAREYGRMDQGATKESSPNNVVHIGLALVNIAKDCKATCSIDAEGEQKRKLLQAWIELYERKFNVTVGRQAKKVAAKKAWEQKKLLPIAEDVLKLNTYLKKEIKESMSNLNASFSMESYDRLNNATMLQLLTFNRKRIGEVQNFLLEDFRRKEKINKDSDIYKGLYESEKILADRFYHVNVKGKLHRAVPVLISEELSAAIDKIISLRESAGVEPNNHFLFAKGKDGFYNASTAMKIAAFDCKAKYPENLTSTGLRKHVATAAQALNLTESDLRKISGFLGHTVQTHLEHYRMPSDAVHTAQVSRLLLALDTSGNLNEFKGKKIDEIEVDIPVLDSYSDQTPSTSRYGEDSEKKELKLKSPKKHTKMHLSPMKSPRKAVTASRTPPSPSKTRFRKKWTTPEKKVMIKAFSHHLETEKLPSFSECYEVKKEYSELISRKVPIIKAWVFNEINRRKRNKKDDTDAEDTDDDL